MNAENKHLLKEDLINVDLKTSICVLTVKEIKKTSGSEKEYFYYEIYKIDQNGVSLIDKIKIEYYETNTNYQVISGHLIVYKYKPILGKRWDNVTDILICYNIEDDIKIFGTIEDILKILGFNINTSKLQYTQIINSDNPNFRVLISNSKKKKVECHNNYFNVELRKKMTGISRFAFNDYLTALKLKSYGLEYENKEKIINIEDYKNRKK